MSERVRAASTDDGTRIARKAALDPTERPRLENEATILGLAVHPGVVTLVGSDPDGLDLAWSGGRTLATHPPTTPGEAAATMAAILTTVADLHQMGITHGGLRPEHVLLDASGRPVLCSLSRAERVDSLLDPGHGTRAAADVAALGRMLEGLLAEMPTRRALSWSSRHHRRRLLEQVAHATTSTHRPSARALAASLADIAATSRRTDTTQVVTDRAVPRRHLLELDDPDGSDAYDLVALDRLRPTEDPPTPGRRRRPGALLGTVGVVVVLTAGVTLATRSVGPDRDLAEPALRSAPVGTVPADTDPPTTTSSTAPSSGPATGPATAPRDVECDDPARQLDAATLRTDVDGDGCADTVTIEGNVVTAGSRRWELGEPGDLIAIADWDCDGGATPALLRPGDGDLFVFDSWAPPRGDVEAALLTTIPHSAGIGADRSPCPDLVVTRTDGTTVHVPVPEEDRP